MFSVFNHNLWETVKIIRMVCKKELNNEDSDLSFK